MNKCWFGIVRVDVSWCRIEWQKRGKNIAMENNKKAKNPCNASNSNKKASAHFRIAKFLYTQDLGITSTVK